MGIVAKVITALLVLVAVGMAIARQYAFAVVLLMIAAAWPLGGYIVDRDRDLAEAGSEHRTPPAGLDGRSWGGGG